MGRPPYCDKVGLKKGPWTPEEDIVLVSYIQEHGPGNWRAVPANSGLKRCRKSCRLRWTNYLRPGIIRGNFNPQEEKMIIHLQALLGNRWAAIASYLPHRTDNDIKNYWNTHLNKKLRKLQGGGEEGQDGNFGPQASATSSHSHHLSSSRGQWERRLQTDIHTAKQALREALSLDKRITTVTAATATATTTNSKSESPSIASNASYPCVQTGPYASNAENIAKLLEKYWMANKPELAQHKCEYSSGCGSGLSTSEDEYSWFESFNSASAMTSDEQSESSRQQEGGTLSLLEKWLFDEAIDVDLHEDQHNLQLVDMF